METPLASATSAGLREATRSVLSTLPPRQAQVLRMRFGIDMLDGCTLEEIGKEFDLTRERIRQIEAKALRTLRLRNHSGHLQDFLEEQ